jgi:hypothetical protein
VGLRICLRLSEQECTRFLAYDNVIPTTFTSPGQALYNDSEGRREGNTEFQVAFVDVAEISAHCAELSNREKTMFGKAVIDSPHIFYGECPAKISLIPEIIGEALPHAYLGQPLRIDGSPVLVTLNARDGANIAAIAQSLDILTHLANNLVAQFMASPSRPALKIIDAFPAADERWQAAIEKGAKIISRQVQLEEALDTLVAEMEKRRCADMGNSHIPEIVFLLEPQASKAFSFATADNPTPSATKLSTLLEQGPRHGIHFVLMTTRLSRIEKVLGIFGRFNLDPFGIRIAFKADDGELANFISYQVSTKNAGAYAGVLSDESIGETTNFQIFDEIPIN